MLENYNCLKYIHPLLFYCNKGIPSLLIDRTSISARPLLSSVTKDQTMPYPVVSSRIGEALFASAINTCISTS
jgi:hypothetical protein